MKTWILVATCAMGLALSTTAQAQDSGIQSELERTASTSPAEKQVYAEASNREIAETNKQVQKLLEGARRESDVDALTCLTSRLTSIRALQQVSTSAEGNMKTALAGGAMERADHEFRKIAVAVSKTRQLGAEAERCIASVSGGDDGETIREVTTSLEGDEVTFGEALIDVLDFGFDPPDVSPFL